MSSEVLESKRKIERTCRNICIHNKIAPFRKYAKPSVSISINYDDTCRHKKNNKVDVQLSFHLFSKSKPPSGSVFSIKVNWSNVDFENLRITVDVEI